MSKSVLRTCCATLLSVILAFAPCVAYAEDEITSALGAVEATELVGGDVPNGASGERVGDAAVQGGVAQKDGAELGQDVPDAADEQGAAVVVQANDGSVEGIVATMTLHEKLAQMVMVACRTWDGANVTSLDEGSGLAAALRKHPYGGVILYGSNVVNNEQTASLISQFQANNTKTGASTVVPYFMAADEEGGTVTRLSAGTRMTGSMGIGATVNAAENAELTGTIIGRELAALGFNVNFAPVADVNSNPANPVIGTRSFSDDPYMVARLAPLFTKGLGASDVIGTYKHFPGHGDTGTDTHIDTSAVYKTIDQLWQTELIPFKAAVDAGAEMIMTAHVTLPLYDDPVTFADGTQGTYPSTMSKKVITTLLRGELGYNGVVVTDALEMDAIEKAGLVEGEPGSVECRANIAEKVINAGVDILLLPLDLRSEEAAGFYDAYFTALEEKVRSGAISEERIDESVTRILSLKQAHGFLSKAKPTGDLSVVGSNEHHAQEMKIAREAITLVKNDDFTLPVSGRGKKIVLIGRTSGDATAIEYAVKDLQEAGLIPSDAYVRNLVAGTESGSGSSSTIITIDYTYSTSPAGLHYTDELQAAVSQADVVAALAKTYSLSALKAEAPQYEAIHQPLVDTHAAGGKFVFLSDNLPYDVARYQAADAILLAYMGTGTELDPTSQIDGTTNTAAFNANVIAAIEAMFDREPPVGSLPVAIPNIQEASDGTLSYADSVLYERGYGQRYHYLFTKGMGGAHTKGTAEGLTFANNARYDRLVAVLVDGATLMSDGCTAMAGSTIITLAPGLLDELTEGTHTLTARYLYEDGSSFDVDTTFSVKAAPAPSPTPTPSGGEKGDSGTPSKSSTKQATTTTSKSLPKTGEDAIIVIPLASLALVFVGTGRFLRRREKEAVR